MFTSTPFVHPAKSLPPFKAQKVKLTHKRFYHCIQKFLKNDHMLLVDTGDAMLSACDLLLPDHIPYIAEAFYLSIGYALPATLGAEKARPDLRPLLFIGDGAFQMTAQELSTLLRNHSHAIIFLLNNEGYTLERVLHEGPFNDIQSWKYHDLPKVFNGDSKSFDIWSEEDLETALFEADQNKGLSFLEVHLAKMDCSENLKRIGKIIRGET